MIRLIRGFRANSLRSAPCTSAAQSEKTPQTQRVRLLTMIRLDTIAAPTKWRRRLASTRTPAGHSGWRSESGACGQGLVTSAPGRLRENARPALRPACDWIAGLGQAETANHRLSATSQEARLELSGGVGSLPREPRWNAGRRSAPRRARAASRRVRMYCVWRLPAFRLPCFFGEWRMASSE